MAFPIRTAVYNNVQCKRTHLELRFFHWRLHGKDYYSHHDFVPVTVGSHQFKAGSIPSTFYVKQLFATKFAADKLPLVSEGVEKPLILPIDQKISAHLQVIHDTLQLLSFQHLALLFNLFSLRPMISKSLFLTIYFQEKEPS